MSSTRLRVRRKVFELGLLPLTPLLPRLDSPAALQSFQRRLLAHSVPANSSSPDRRLVTLSALCDALGVTQTVAQVLVDVLDAVAPAGSAPGGGGEPGAGVDAHHLLLLLFVNTYSRPHVQSAIRNAGDVWPAGDTQGQQPQVGPGSTASPAPGGAAHALQVATASKSGLSPTKTARRGGALHGVTGSAAEDEVLQRSFVLRHLSALLPLLRSTPAAGTAGSDVQLSVAEFDRIGFLFSLADHPPGTRLSEVAPAFAGGVQKSIAIGAARDWLNHSCLPPGPTVRGASVNGSATAASPAGVTASSLHLFPGDARVEGCQRATLLLRDTDVSCTGAIRLWDCSEAIIYCLAPCAVTSLSNCMDCTVIVGACAAALRLEHCERCTVVAAAAHVQLRSCHGCNLHVFTPSPVLVLGDTRHCRVGPHNTWYDALGAHLQRVGLPSGGAAAGNKCFEAYTLNPPAHVQLHAVGEGKSQQGAPNSGGCGLTCLPPDEYAPMVVPFSVASPASGGDAAPSTAETASLPAGGGAAPSSPFALPAAYLSALEVRLRRVADVQAAVRDAQLDDGRRRELQAAIQGHFREFLLNSGKMREVVDLSRVSTNATSGGPTTGAQAAESATAL